MNLRAEQEELKMLREMFRTVDADGNGFLDEVELQKVFINDELNNSGLGCSASTAHLLQENWFETVMESIDKDQDGRVNWEEFITASIDKSKLLNEENLQIAFDWLDDNKDGKISRYELSKCLAGSVCDNLGMHSIEVSIESWERFIENCDQD